MHTDVDDEAALRRAFEAVVGRVTAPTADLVGAGLAHGRRLRRRRSATVIATIAAAFVVAVVAPLMLALRPDGATDPTISPAVTETMVPLTPRSAAAILVRLMPSNGRLDDFAGQQETWSPSEWAIQGDLTYDDGHGLVQVGAVFTLGDPALFGVTDPPDEFYLDPCSARGVVVCERSTLPDGSELLMIEYQRADGPGSAGERNWPSHSRGATLIRPDGHRISVSLHNNVAPGGWNGPPTRPDLPLSMDQLVAMVQSPLWQETVPMSIAEAGLRLEPFRRTPDVGGPPPIG